MVAGKLKDGYRAIDSCELSFQDYRVPVDRLLGGVEGKGFSRRGGSGTGSINVPRGAWALRKCTDAFAAVCAGAQCFWQADRQPPGDPTQTRRHGDTGGRAKQLIDHAALKYDAGERCDLEAAMAKLEAPKPEPIAAGGHADLRRVQLSVEYEIERLLPRCMLMCIGEGSNEILRTVIANNSCIATGSDHEPEPAFARRARHECGAIRRRSFGSMVLADLGAEVIKIESPRDGAMCRARPGRPDREDPAHRQPVLSDLQPQQEEPDAGPQERGRSNRAATPGGDLRWRHEQSARRQPPQAGIDLCGAGRVNLHCVRAPLRLWSRQRARFLAGYDYLMQAEAGYLHLTGEPTDRPRAWA